MAKFDISDWCDYVRGIADPAQSDAMRSQLETTGAAPRVLVDRLRRVAEVGRFDNALEIPEHALRVAKAAGSLRRPQATEEGATGWVASLLRQLPFTITFDSLRQPAPVGTRNLQGADRQLSLEAEDFKVDLRLEHDTDPNSTVVVGQVVRRRMDDPEAEAEPVTNLPVLAVEGGRIVGRSSTGSFGEFQAEGLPNDTLSLCFLVGPEECIELPLGAG